MYEYWHIKLLRKKLSPRVISHSSWLNWGCYPAILNNPSKLELSAKRRAWCKKMNFHMSLSHVIHMISTEPMIISIETWWVEN